MEFPESKACMNIFPNKFYHLSCLMKSLWDKVWRVWVDFFLIQKLDWCHVINVRWMITLQERIRRKMQRSNLWIVSKNAFIFLFCFFTFKIFSFFMIFEHGPCNWIWFYLNTRVQFSTPLYNPLQIGSL